MLRTQRLQSVVEWEPADLTTGLDAGMTLAAVQAALARRGQQIPIDAPLPGQATLGGLVATDTSGPRRWLYGGWRDLIIGMQMALTDGAVVKGGGRVVKNVQGYDLAKLFTGSLGTLGLIGRIYVKLVPLTATRRLVAARGTLTARGRLPRRFRHGSPQCTRAARARRVREHRPCTPGRGPPSSGHGLPRSTCSLD